MPVFSRNGVHILYIHVPKTGGTSVEDFFQRNEFVVSYLDRDIKPAGLNVVRRCSPQHMSRHQLEATFNIGQFKYVFMTVRNPYARLISTFRMRHARPGHSVDFDVWASSALERCSNSPYIFDNHIRPQADFYVARAEIFKQEDGYEANWVKQVSLKTGLKFSFPNMKHQMVSNKEGQKTVMKDHTKELVKNIYANDFAQFGYTT